VNAAAASGAALAQRGDWLMHSELGAVQVVERLDRWGVRTLRVWAPATGAVLQVEETTVEPLETQVLSPRAIVHRAAAARVQEGDRPRRRRRSLDIRAPCFARSEARPACEG
jgi:hypothetical protein